MSYDPDEQFAQQLAVLEDRIASGGLNAADTQINEDSVISSRLHDALDCLQTLERIWPRHAETTAPALPRNIGRFTLVRELGRGGFGVVHLAEDRQLNRDVAIKLQRPEAVLSPDARRRFLKEAKASAPLNHPNLVTVFDSGEDGLWCWIASEAVKGPSLGAFLADKPAISVEAACRLVAKLADGVAHAHLHNVLHRDIKPSNVLLQPKVPELRVAGSDHREGPISHPPGPSLRSDPATQMEALSGRVPQPASLDDYTPKLTDFGLARSLEQETGETRTGARLGTPAYMAPEQIEGKKTAIGEATDVYGLGVLLYELLAGHSPFAADTETDILRRVLLEEPPSLRKARPEVSRDLEAIVLKALEKSPGKRYVSARALADDLRRLLNHQPTEARPLNVAQQLLKKAGRNPAICLAVISGLAALGLLFESDHVPRLRQQLLDVRGVTLATFPADARIAFAPLDEMTGEPIANGVIHASGLSPVSLELPPGDYLVIAVLSDGRFHEVHRHVPKPGEVAELYAHHRWRTIDEFTVELPTITIPDKAVSADMVEMAEPVPADGASSPGGRHFFLDRFECRYADLLKKYPTLANNPWLAWAANGRTNDRRFAAIVSHDQALAYAEHAGKRLPSLAEYELARRQCQPLSDEDRAKLSAADKRGFAPVGHPEMDATDTVPRIVGLRSNVAEWTSTVSPVQPAIPPGVRYWLDYRFVCGGSHNTIEAVNVRSTEIHERDEAISVFRHATQPGVGFRCARSASPRFIDPPSNK